MGAQTTMLARSRVSALLLLLASVAAHGTPLDSVPGERLTVAPHSVEFSAAGDAVDMPLLMESLIATLLTRPAAEQ